MEMEEIHENACKMSLLSNKITGQRRGGEHFQEDQEDEDAEDQKAAAAAAAAAAVTESNRLRAWHSSRIFRVSRASGGKDRHSKVLTAKGLRDRRVRLSVSTAIQFYDLQDRLGYDQPSKAVEWLIKAAADAIAELPSLDSKFPETPKQPSEDEKRGVITSRGRFEVELENDPSFQQHKSACSSTSETSKGSVLSLSRTEIRVKARERARERAAKDKDQPMDECQCPPQPNSQNSSFTDLLNSGGGGNNNTRSPNQSTPHNQTSPAPGFFLKSTRHSPPTSMDYFTSGLFGPVSSSRNHFSSGFQTQSHFGITPSTHTMTMAPFSITNDHHQHQHHHPELQQFSFLSDHLIPDTQPGGVSGSDYNLNFSISSGLAGYNRGTLQSNSSPSQLPPHFQRFSSPAAAATAADGSNMPFYVGNATASNATPPEDDQFPAGFDGRLQLYYGDGSRHSDSKGKEKH